MAYDEEIKRGQPGVFLFLIDQSGSMGAPFGRADKSGNTPTKAQEVANALNWTLAEIIERCRKAEGLRDYFEIGIIGYGQHSSATFCWSGQLAGREMVALSEVDRCAEIGNVEEEVVIHNVVEKNKIEVKVWVKPIAAGGTPMKSALELARTVLEPWMKQYPRSYPPIIINITDGEATDADSETLLRAANGITSLVNANGSNALLINCHISELADFPVMFPAKREEVPRESSAQVLFDMSSVLPAQMKGVAAELLKRHAFNEPMRGIVFNGNAVMLVKFLDIGTRPALDNVK